MITIQAAEDAADTLPRGPPQLSSCSLQLPWGVAVCDDVLPSQAPTAIGCSLQGHRDLPSLDVGQPMITRLLTTPGTTPY